MTDSTFVFLYLDPHSLMQKQLLLFLGSTKKDKTSNKTQIDKENPRNVKHNNIQTTQQQKIMQTIQKHICALECVCVCVLTVYMNSV